MPPTTTTEAAERRCGGGASVPRSTRLVLLTVSLLSAAVHVRSEPFDGVNGTRLAAVADDFRLGWPATRARSGQVKMRLRPVGEPSLWSSDRAVCGYDFTAEAAAVDSARKRPLPAAAAFQCGDGGRDAYRVGVPAAEGASAAAYETVAFLGEGARAATVRLETAGETGVPLTDLCFGFVDGDAVRAVCADVELLTACRRWKDLKGNLDFGLNYVQLKAHRDYAVREIVFRDVHALAPAFEALTRNTADEAARRDVCQRIEFTDSEDGTHEGCVGHRVSAADDGGPAVREFKFTSRGLLVDVDDTSYACQRRSDANAELDDDNGGDPQTSGGRAPHAFPNGFLFVFSFITVLLKSVVA